MSHPSYNKVGSQYGNKINDNTFDRQSGYTQTTPHPNENIVGLLFS